MANIPNLPSTQQIPPGPLSWLKDWLDTVRLWVLTRDPTALTIGDPVDKFTTRGELISLGLIKRKSLTEFSVGIGGIAGPKGDTGVKGDTGAGVPTPDLSPVPTPTGLTMIAGLSYLFISWDAPTYTLGHGHFQTRIYGAIWPAGDTEPTFMDSRTKLIDVITSRGSLSSYPTSLGTRWAIWITFVSNDGVESIPAGGAHGVQATTGVIGSADLGPLIVLAGNLADGSVSASKVLAASLDATRFASSIEPITMVAGSVVPLTKSTTNIWVIGLEKLYKWVGAAYTASVAVADLAGQITSTQILDGAITTPKMTANTIDGSVITGGTMNANKLTANSITAGQIQAFAIGAGQIAAGAITTGKLLVTGQGAAINPDPGCMDATAWTNNALPTAIVDATVPVGSSAFESVTGGPGLYSSFFPIDPTKNYRLTMWVKTVSGAPNTYLTVAFYNSSNAIVVGTGWPSAGSYNYYGLTNQTPPSVWTKYTIAFGPGETAKIPATAVQMFVGHLGVYSPSTGVFRVTDIRVVEKTDYDLIVDGAIIASKLAANSIAVGSAAIQNGAIVNAMIGIAAIDSAKIANATITDAQIGSLNADKITAGTILAARIGANSLDATKIDTRGLSIRNAAGTVILAAGSALDFNSRFGGDTTGMPANGATVGATWGSNLSGQPSDAALLNAQQTWAQVNAKPADTDLLNSHQQGSVTVINHPAGGNAAFNAPGVVGALKIRLPQGWSNTMLRFFVEVYEYSTDKSFTLEVGGYNYSSGAWYNTYAKMVGSADAEKTIRFGYDGTYCAVWIGEPGSVWEYPQVIVTGVRAGYSNYAVATWQSGWQVTLDTSAISGHGINYTQSSPLTGASWTQIPGGTGKAADYATQNQSDTTTNNGIASAGTTSWWSGVSNNDGQRPANGATANQSDTTTNDAIATKISKTTASILSATVSIDAVSGAGFVAGNLTWNAAGGRTGGSGVAMTPGGLLGHNGSTPTFSINATTGAVAIAGDLTGSTGTFSGSLSAASGTLGALTINSGGNIKQGQSAYNTGAGFWLGDASGTTKLSIGNPSGSFITWDGTALRVNDATFDAFSVVIGGSWPNYTTTVTGGKAGYTYIWIAQSTSGYTYGLPYISSGILSSNCSLAITAAQDGTGYGVLILFVKDSNGRQAGATKTFSFFSIGGAGGGTD